jgi:CelD/BcsL family acetyltransferase involved in cellulose biosynthesis
MTYVSASEPAMLMRLGRDSVSLAPVGSRPVSEPEALPVTFEVIRERAGLDALEPEWNDLFRRAGRSAQLFQTFNWNWHWANHYLSATPGGRGGPSLAIVAVRREGRLVMLWPLVLERAVGLRVLRWMGEPVSQYGDVLAEDLPDGLRLMRQAWRFIAARLGADVVCLRKVRADAAIAPLLRELGMQQTDATEAPYLDLASAPDFARYEQRYTGKARKNRRRLARRLAEQGPLSIERHTGGAEARAAAPLAITLKREWIKQTGRVSRALGDERFAAFFADVAEGRIRPAGCGVTVLTSNGAPAGIAVDITCGERRAAHIIVHDPRLEPFSPGTLLLEAWIKGASADGIATFDLLAPAYAYKLDWADGTVAVGDFARGLTLAGRAWVHLWLGLARRAAKAAAEALPHFLGRLRALVRRAALVGWVKRSADPTPVSGGE